VAAKISYRAFHGFTDAAGNRYKYAPNYRRLVNASGQTIYRLDDVNWDGSVATLRVGEAGELDPMLPWLVLVGWHLHIHGNEGGIGL
jgi:hypothetical protein